MSKLITKLPDWRGSISDSIWRGFQEQSKSLRDNAAAIKDLNFFKEWVNDKRKWRLPRVSFDTFLDSPNYLGVGDKIYPAIRKIAKDIIENNYAEGVIVAGIGSGKTTASELIACYSAHTLLCLRDPHETYKLAKDKPITIMNMGITATQALEVTFAGIKNLIQRSPFFHRFSPNILQGSIRFAHNNILLMSGNSKSTTPLGYNIFCAILDEAAFYLDNDNKQLAEEIYTALQRRIVSRFGYDGLVMMISSPRYEDDFIMRKLKEAIKFPDVIYSKQLPTWECKPPSDADIKNSFYFNNRKGLVEDTVPTNFGKVNKIGDEFNCLDEIWEIPGEYKKSFLQDPDKAKRDFAAIPSLTIQGFIPHLEILETMFSEDASPVTETDKYEFKEPALRVNYYIHIDLALNKAGKGDSCGFSMAHFGGWEVNEITGERQKKVVVDLAEQITAGPTGEIRFEDVRNKVYALKKMGFNIKLVTLDQFQSADTIQILRAKGVRADYLSVDRTIEPYQTLKELIYSKRVTCHKMPRLLTELSRLEITKANKIDHPPGGSKDVADAVCGAVYNVIQNAGGELGMAVGGLTTKTVVKSEQKSAQEEHYETLQDLLDQGLI